MHDKEKVWGGPAPETAFLGPQIWDKKLPMKVFNHEPGWPQQQHQHHGVGGGYHSAGRDSNDSTPSPPRYIEVSEIQVYTNIDCWLLTAPEIPELADQVWDEQLRHTSRHVETGYRHEVQSSRLWSSSGHGSWSQLWSNQASILSRGTQASTNHQEEEKGKKYFNIIYIFKYY